MTIEEFTELTDRLLDDQKGFDGVSPVATSWCNGLRAMKAHIDEFGWPASRAMDDHSIMPAISRTAIYDDIDWWDRAADWGHLAGYIVLDLAFHHQGRLRNELTGEEFDRWVEASREAGKGRRPKR